MVVKLLVGDLLLLCFVNLGVLVNRGSGYCCSLGSIGWLMCIVGNWVVGCCLCMG